VGRDGALSLRFARRDGRTVLASRRFRAPLQIFEPLDLAGDGSVWAVLLNPAGGILGGDILRTEIDVGPGAHVGVTTPSATKVYRCPGLPAAQHTSIRVGAEATLEYRPHHLIPHAGAAFAQTLRVDLQARSRLLLYDGVALGRAARGERWAFRSLSNEIRVSDDRGPLFWERAHLSPKLATGLAGLAGDDSCGYLGTLVFCDVERADWNEMLSAVWERLAEEPGLRAGASLLARGGLVIKVLAGSADPLLAFLRVAWDLGRRHLLGGPPLDLRL
jgi:urease accessory protein